MPRIPRLGRSTTTDSPSSQPTEQFAVPASEPQPAVTAPMDAIAEPVPDAQPAGAAPEPELSFRDRARMRRRLRYLRRARELAFRDLGGLAFDLHRFQRRRDDLVQAKLGTLSAIDEELRALEIALDDRQPLTLLREPGISACPRCAALHGTDAKFCPNCGLPVGPAAERAIAPAGAVEQTAVVPAAGAPSEPPPAPEVPETAAEPSPGAVHTASGPSPANGS